MVRHRRKEKERLVPPTLRSACPSTVSLGTAYHMRLPVDDVKDHQSKLEVVGPTMSGATMARDGGSTLIIIAYQASTYISYYQL